MEMEGIEPTSSHLRDLDLQSRAGPLCFCILCVLSDTFTPFHDETITISFCDFVLPIKTSTAPSVLCFVTRITRTCNSLPPLCYDVDGSLVHPLTNTSAPIGFRELGMSFPILFRHTFSIGFLHVKLDGTNSCSTTRFTDREEAQRLRSIFALV